MSGNGCPGPGLGPDASGDPSEDRAGKDRNRTGGPPVGPATRPKPMSTVRHDPRIATEGRASYHHGAARRSSRWSCRRGSPGSYGGRSATTSSETRGALRFCPSTGPTPGGRAEQWTGRPSGSTRGSGSRSASSARHCSCRGCSSSGSSPKPGRGGRAGRLLVAEPGRRPDHAGVRDLQPRPGHHVRRRPRLVRLHRGTSS